MTPRRWENIAKYFFDLSKLVVASAVISQLVSKDFSQKIFAFGSLNAILFFVAGYFFDRQGDQL
ncbi:MAG: hypothetical protein Q7T11_02015 [Deltaproteobacteria bacterium]|nr:hypothetical protein [Deltaproteobacteria bacterium]